MLRDEKNAALAYAKDMNLWVKDAVATDDTTATITFNQTAPRFMYDFLMHKFDLGILLVPEHIFKDQADILSFLFYDPAQNWPITTGPYKIVDWTPQQRLLDLRPDWWAAKTGFSELPKVERIITVPWPDATGGAQAMINNEIDTSLDHRPPVMKTILDQNPKVITHTLREPPYGYTDWWPNSLWFNCSEPPFDDLDVRMAVNHSIDRNQIVEIGYEGAGVTTDLPFPEFPSLKQYFDAAKPLLDQYPTSAYDPAKTDEIMTAKGYTRDGEGLWVDASGNRIDLTIYGFEIFGDYGPVLAEQLRAGGFEASFQAPPDAYTKMDDGSGKTFLFGHGGAIADVYPTLNLFHSRYARPTGETGGITPRWKNEEYDRIVDEMAALPVADPKGTELYLQALEIYLKEKPELPVVQWLHRIPYNTTYWTNWPTVENSYVNGAFWHKTFILILQQLQPATA
jgi:peptide/nickel transport system substrate-binding protein